MKHGIDARRICIGGFSQGGAVALATALTTRIAGSELGGAVVCSSYLPIRQRLIGGSDDGIDASANGERLMQVSPSLPVAMFHGTADCIVRAEIGAKSHAFLKTRGALTNCTFSTYAGMQHAFCADEVHDIVRFLQSIFK